MEIGTLVKNPRPSGSDDFAMVCAKGVDLCKTVKKSTDTALGNGNSRYMRLP